MCKHFFIWFFVFVCAGPCVSVWASADVESLDAAISNQVAEVRRLAEKLYHIEHRMDYDDPLIAKMHKEIKEMEARILKLREAIQNQLLANEAYQEARREHIEAFKELSRLKERKRDLENN